MKFSKPTFPIKSVLLLLVALMPFAMMAQSTVNGTVTEKNGTPIFGANVYLDGTYDGATTNEQGVFSFQTSETDVQTLTVSYVSFETFMMAAAITQMKDLRISLRDDVNSLDTVVISAGTFEAGDNLSLIHI